MSQHTSLLTTDPADRMSRRAQLYLVICTLRLLLMGIVCLTEPGSFTSSSYRGMLEAIPWGDGDEAIQAWGVIFIIPGLFAAYATMLREARPARWALILSVAVTGAYFASFLVSAMLGDLAGWSGPIIWGAVVLKDLTMIRDPLRNPFESLVKRLAPKNA